MTSETSARNASNDSANGNGNEADEDEDGDEILVIGVREKTSSFAENRLSINPGGAWLQAYQAPTGGLSDAVPWFLRNLLDLSTTITIGEEFDARHVKLAQEAIKRLASLPQFKAAYERMQSQNLDIDIHVVTRPDQISKPSDYGNTQGRNGDGTVSNGAHIDIYINLNRLAAELSDFQFQVTVIHELIHVFGNAQWSDRLDAPNSTWDREIYNAAFSRTSQLEGASMIEATGAGGGALQATIEGAVLVGSQGSDDLATVSSGNTVFSGAGDDRISISVAGRPLIRDDGGYDTILVRDASSVSSLSARWSQDGQDVALYNDGMMIALLAGSATGGAFEAVQVGGSVVSLASLMAQPNAAPTVQDQLMEVHGTYQGLVGSIAGFDAEGDRIDYRMVEIEGAYADRAWRVTDDGQVFADFLREDRPGSEFTTLRIVAADGLSSAPMELTVRWASDDSPQPELGRLSGDWSGSSDEALASNNHPVIG